MEAHLIGEVVPQDVLDGGAIGADDVTGDALADIIGYPADAGVGAEGGRRRQVRNPEAYPAAEQVEAARRYADAGMATLPISAMIGMTNAQRERYENIQTQSAMWNGREAELCDAINNIVDGRPAKALEVLGITATAYQRMRAIHSCYLKLSIR